MNKNKNISILFLFVLISVLTKWLILQIYFENNVITNVITTIEDKQYFPLIISFSNFDFNPSYIDEINNLKIISFPIYGILLHSIFYSFLGVYTFIFLEFLFQFVFFFILYKTIEQLFKDSNKSFFFCLTIILTVVFFEFFSSYTESRYFYFIYDLLNENIGTRTPRPLITGVFYFLFYLIIFRLKNNINFNNNFNYFVLIIFLLSLFLNSFFYYFINFSILFLFLFYRYSKQNILRIFINNKKKLIILFLYFLIFTTPFILQIYFSEKDYSSRLGVIGIDFEKKVFLLKYYFTNLLRKEFLVIILPCLIIYYLSNIKKNTNYKNEKINIFFFFIVASLVSPPLFFILSPFIVSIYHFLGILIFSCLLYLFITIFSFFYEKFISFKKILNFNIIIVILLIFYTAFNYTVYKNNILKDYDLRIELNSIQNFFEKNDLKKTSFRLFTNDLKIMDMWLLNKNTQLLISDGFTNALTNDQIEFNLINNLKDFSISENDFKKIISYEKSQLRNYLFMTLFTYKYQANSLHTYSSLDNFTDNYPDIIKKTSPFRAQSQIVPENEKIRLLNLFTNHKIDRDLLSDYVVINHSNKWNLNNLKIINQDYLEVFSSLNYKIYKRNTN